MSAAELTVKTLLSHLFTGELGSREYHSNITLENRLFDACNIVPDKYKPTEACLYMYMELHIRSYVYIVTDLG